MVLETNIWCTPNNEKVGDRVTSFVRWWGRMGSALGRKLSAGNFRRRLLQSISAARRDDERAKVAGSDEPTSEQDRCVCVCEQMAGGG